MNYREKIESLRERLRRYRQAEDAVLTGQSYEVDGMRLTRADLKTIAGIIAGLVAEITRLESREIPAMKRSRMRVAIPSDSMRFRP